MNIHIYHALFLPSASGQQGYTTEGWLQSTQPQSHQQSWVDSTQAASQPPTITEQAQPGQGHDPGTVTQQQWGVQDAQGQAQGHTGWDGSQQVAWNQNAYDGSYLGYVQRECRRQCYRKYNSFRMYHVLLSRLL